MRILDALLTLPQYVAPQRLLTSLAGRVAKSRHPLVKSLLIRAFTAFYRVDMSEARETDPFAYASFSAFFTRTLRPQARPIAQAANTLVSPADGVVSQCGPIGSGQLVQAKGRHYSVAALLAGDLALARRVHAGSFATIYLAPRDYHRVHVPFEGEVVRVRYVPGRLFSVNRRTARTVDRLFARNERVVVEMRSAHGTVVVILVGAMIVGSMRLAFCDIAGALAAAGRTRVPFVVDVPSAHRCLSRGAEFGTFDLGSTVIVLTEAALEWAPLVAPAAPVRVGQALAAFPGPTISRDTG